MTPTSVLARRPTLPGASVSVKEGVLKQFIFIYLLQLGCYPVAVVINTGLTMHNDASDTPSHLNLF